MRIKKLFINIHQVVFFYASPCTEQEPNLANCENETAIDLK